MCGVAGFITKDFSQADYSLITKMLASMKHRGPDDSHVWTSRNLALGACRLSIIDLSEAASQPMFLSYAGSRYVLAYNGEVYNFRELRAQGHVYRSQSDTEVVLTALAEDTLALRNFNGMFAFALYNEQAHTVTLARDRYGIKPLYYYEDASVFAFASEIKALQYLVKHDAVDLPALRDYFTFQNQLSDGTLFEGIHVLEPGTYLVYDLLKHKFITHTYFKLEFRESLKISFDEAAEETRRLFEQAVKRQLVSDVPVASCLSAGIDSSSIVAISSKQIPRLHTFTGGFNAVPGYDESPLAACSALAHNTEHFVAMIGPRAFEDTLHDVVYHLEDLRCSISYCDYLVYELASKYAKVVLSGAGGDELFAGYTWRYAVQDYKLMWQRLVPVADHASFFSQQVIKATSRYEPLDQFPKRTATLNQKLTFEANSFLRGLLFVTDKLSSAHSLEARVPFLDNDLVDFALKLPQDYKLNDGTGKLVMREAMKGLVPEEVRVRKKQGFYPPDEHWYRGPTRAFVTERIESVAKSGYFNEARVRGLLQEHLQGLDRTTLIYSLVCFDEWLKIFA